MVPVPDSCFGKLTVLYMAIARFFVGLERNLP